MKDRLNRDDIVYQIYLSARNNSSQHKLKEAINNAIKSDNQKLSEPLWISYNSEIVPSSEMPELSIVDYLLWSLQRYILKGQKRFFNALEDKYDLIIDLYYFDNEVELRYR